MQLPHRLFAVLAIALPFAAIATPLALAEEEADLTLERIFDSDEFSSESFSAKWLPDGSGYTTLEKASGPSGGRDLVLHHPTGGEREVLVSAELLVPPGKTQPLEIEGYALSADLPLLLVYTNSVRVWRYNTRGDYWLLDRSSRELRKLGGDAPPSSLMFAKLSPRGGHVAYVRDGNLYVEDLHGGDVRALSTSDSEHVINGTFDWVYEEALGLRDGFRWCPEGREIAYWQIDTEGVRRFPLLVYVYGEPAGQTVLDRWGGKSYLWHLLLSQRGYCVMSFDNRGTPAPRGRAWRKVVYRQVGVLTPEEQAAALRRVLDERPYLDRERVGIWGWSGGGSMSLHAILKHPDLYHTALAVAPVPNQRSYDTIYQERFMGLPEGNVEGFRKGSAINYARQLEGNLLIVHGTGDDKCHYQGTEALVNELVRHRKPFTLMAYRNRSHSIREGLHTTLHLRSLLTRYLLEHLPAGPREATNPAAPAASEDASRTATGEARENVLREIEGWRVHVDRELLGDAAGELGAEALKVLAHELYEIRLRVPAARLSQLQAVPIWIDCRHDLKALQYHPSAKWLVEHGYDPRLEKCVHVPRAAQLVELQRTNHQPWVLLHELAHAFHDRVLGFDDPEIRAAYERVKAAGIYDRVLLNRGQPTRHYALTDPKEFFAEMSEAYFGTNDFYPFVAAELREHDPETFALLERIWSPPGAESE